MVLQASQISAEVPACNLARSIRLPKAMLEEGSLVSATNTAAAVSDALLNEGELQDR